MGPSCSILMDQITPDSTRSMCVSRIRDQDQKLIRKAPGSAVESLGLRNLLKGALFVIVLFKTELCRCTTHMDCIFPAINAGKEPTMTQFWLYRTLHIGFGIALLTFLVKNICHTTGKTLNGSGPAILAVYNMILHNKAKLNLKECPLI